MFARFLALVGLSIIGPSIGRSEPVGPAQRELVVYYKSSGNVETQLLHSLSVELARLMATAGYQLDVQPLASQRGKSAPVEHLVMLDLQGACSSSPDAEASHGETSSLASSAVVDGHVLPFATINCGVLNRMFAAARFQAQPGVREELYGRSIGRIVAHELYHILADEIGHQQAGVSKACFRMSDLLSDDFSFDQAALQRLRLQPVYLSQLGPAPGSK